MLQLQSELGCRGWTGAQTSRLVSLVLLLKDIEHIQRGRDLSQEEFEIRLTDGKTFVFSGFADKTTVMERIKGFMTAANLRHERLHSQLVGPLQ